MALQNSTLLSTEIIHYLVLNINDNQIVHIMAMGALNPSRFMGSLSDQHSMLMQKQVQSAKHHWALVKEIQLRARNTQMGGGGVCGWGWGCKCDA